MKKVMSQRLKPKVVNNFNLTKLHDTRSNSVEVEKSRTFFLDSSTLWMWHEWQGSRP